MDFESVVGGLTVLIIFVGMSVPIMVFGFIYYLGKRLEHRQILAAIEKGTPLTELRPPEKEKANPTGPAWIKYLSGGIAWIIVAVSLFYWLYLQRFDIESIMFLVPSILFAIGIAWLIRGLLYRKYQTSVESSEKSGTAIY